MATKTNPLNAIYFPVEKVSGADLIDDMLFNNKHSNFIIAQTPQGKRVLAAVSPKYTLIPNRELIEPIYQKLKEEFDFEVKVQQHGYSKFYIDFLFNKNKVDLAKDDIVPKLRLHNSYDGGLKFEFHAGFERVVCTNGMTVPVKGAHNKVKLMHTPGTKGINDTTLRYVDNFLENSKEILSIYEPLAKTKLNMGSALEMIENLGKDKIIGPKLVETAKFRLAHEKDLGLPITEFLVYSAANYAINHSPGKILPHKREKQDLNLLNHMLKS